MNNAMNPKIMNLTALVVALGSLALVSCAPKTESTSITPQAMADALHSVMAADRTIYTRQVVNRLQNEQKVILASEHWKNEKALPLPAQMFRMGAELVQEQGANFSYALLSIWPVNKKNGPKTDVEKTGLQYVVDHAKTNYYAEEVLAGQRYFTAVYPDTAVSPACVTCHNGHKDSPRTDFKLGDVMGGVVIRIPLGK